MRIHSIDYLRGLMALSIVFYHFSISFTNWGMADSGTLLGRLGIYAVSTFYVISGMALYLSHKNESWDLKSYAIFMLRRFVRLAPVYWIGLFVFTMFCIQYYGSITVDTWRYIQNILLIFGITNPTDYMLMGGWSIGNEVVFYLLFPLLIIMLSGRIQTVILLTLSIVMFVYCGFFYLDSKVDLVPQWGLYINPLNQIYFFVFGLILAKYLQPHAGKSKVFVLLGMLLSFCIFLAFPVGGNQINIIVGWNKVVLSTSIVLLCAFFFLIGELKRFKIVHNFFQFMGDVSYPLYLLHGVFFLYYRKTFYRASMSNGELLIHGLLLLLVLLLVSWFCHKLIEKPAIKIAKKLIGAQKISLAK
ncbi:acyltransferase family protein [Enterobacter ludwigii]